MFAISPCEVFSGIGRADEPDVGYLPTAEEFTEDTYEVFVSPFSPKAAQVCIESWLILINKRKQLLLIQPVKGGEEKSSPPFLCSHGN